MGRSALIFTEMNHCNLHDFHNQPKKNVDKVNKYMFKVNGKDIRTSFLCLYC